MDEDEFVCLRAQLPPYRVPIALRSTATGAVHPADAMARTAGSSDDPV